MKNVGLYDNDLSVPRKKDLDEKQGAILVDGILKGDGAGGVSAAVANTDYATCTNLINGKGNNSLVLKGQGPYNEGQYACSFAMGGNGASGDASFTNGINASASGSGSHAEGSSCYATGDQSHAEGVSTTGSGKAAHSEGRETSALGDYSHAEGLGTVAKYRSQHTEGEFNIKDNSETSTSGTRGNYINIVGNGTGDQDYKRSNAHTLDWSGNAWFAGDVYVGSTSGTNKDAGSKKLITADEVAGAIDLDVLKEVYFGTTGTLLAGDIAAIDPSALSSLTTDLQYILLDTNGHTFVDRPRPCIRAQISEDNLTTFILKYSGVGYDEYHSVFSGICFDHGSQTQYSVNLYCDLGDGEFEQVLLTEISAPGATYSATLTAAGWQTSGAWKTQTVTVSGLKASYNAAPFVDVALTGTDAAADAELAAAWIGISATAIANTAANSLTVKFPATVDTPTVNIPIRITTYD